MWDFVENLMNEILIYWENMLPFKLSFKAKVNIVQSIKSDSSWVITRTLTPLPSQSLTQVKALSIFL